MDSTSLLVEIEKNFFVWDSLRRDVTSGVSFLFFWST